MMYAIFENGSLVTTSIQYVPSPSLAHRSVALPSGSDETSAYKIDGDDVIEIKRPRLACVFDFGLCEWVTPLGVFEIEVKRKRNQLLQQSDWTQLPDVPLVTKNAWATYRQALRDITEQPGYPLEVAWPVAPA